MASPERVNTCEREPHVSHPGDDAQQAAFLIVLVLACIIGAAALPLILTLAVV